MQLAIGSMLEHLMNKLIKFSIWFCFVGFAAFATPVFAAEPGNEQESEAQESDETAVSPETVSTDSNTNGDADENENDETITTQKRGYRLSVGPFLGVRTMTMEGDRSSYEHNAPFYMGGMLDAELRLLHLPGALGELWLQADAGYGRTIGGFGHADLANRSTALAFLSGQLLLKRSLSDVWDLQVGLGMQALSLTVEPNATYTGHRYVGPQFGVDARRWFDNRGLYLGVELYALPVLWVNQSHETNDMQSFGFRTGAELGWSPGNSDWTLRLRYRFQRFRSQFPLAREGSRGAISEDNQHLLMLMLSY